MGLGGQWGEDTRNRDGKQQYEGDLEVWPLWAQLERNCAVQNTRQRMPPVWREAARHKTRQSSISSEALHLLSEWDSQTNERHGWHPDQITLGSGKKVHWVVHDECKLGLVHRWQAPPYSSCVSGHDSPFPLGRAVCACNSLAVQCPEAADLWDHQVNGGMTPGNITVQSAHVAC